MNVDDSMNAAARAIRRRPTEVLPAYLAGTATTIVVQSVFVVAAVLAFLSIQNERELRVAIAEGRDLGEVSPQSPAFDVQVEQFAEAVADLFTPTVLGIFAVAGLLAVVLGILVRSAATAAKVHTAWGTVTDGQPAEAAVGGTLADTWAFVRFTLLQAGAFVLVPVVVVGLAAAAAGPLGAVFAGLFLLVYALVTYFALLFVPEAMVADDVGVLAGVRRNLSFLRAEPGRAVLFVLLQIGSAFVIGTVSTAAGLVGVPRVTGLATLFLVTPFLGLAKMGIYADPYRHEAVPAGPERSGRGQTGRSGPGDEPRGRPDDATSGDQRRGEWTDRGNRADDPAPGGRPDGRRYDDVDPARGPSDEEPRGGVDDRSRGSESGAARDRERDRRGSPERPPGDGDRDVTRLQDDRARGRTGERNRRGETGDAWSDGPDRGRAERRQRRGDPGPMGRPESRSPRPEPRGRAGPEVPVSGPIRGESILADLRALFAAGLGELRDFTTRRIGLVGLSLVAFFLGVAGGYAVSVSTGIDLVSGREAAFSFGFFPLDTAINLTANNWQVAINQAFAGLAFGVPTLVNLAFNGIIVGGLGGLGFDPLTFAALIVPHGLLEVPALAISGALGLHLAGRGWALVRGRIDTQEASDELERAFLILVGLLPVFLIAGLIEAFLTPAIGGIVAG